MIMVFDARGRRKGTKRCKDFHEWVTLRVEVNEDNEVFAIQKCKHCGIVRKQYIKTLR